MNGPKALIPRWFMKKAIMSQRHTFLLQPTIRVTFFQNSLLIGIEFYFYQWHHIIMMKQGTAMYGKATLVMDQNGTFSSYVHEIRN